MRAAIERVAAQLGNTPAVCRTAYVHPEVLNAYLDRQLVLETRQEAEDELRDALDRLGPEEAAVLALLRNRLQESLGAG